jgi:hypothetical protein
MGEGTAVVSPQSADGAERPAAIEREIRGLRADLDHLIGELDRRRHEMLDVKLQVRRHAVPVSLTALGLALATGGAVAYSVWRARRRRTLAAKAGRLTEAVSRMIERPERVAAAEPAGARILGAAGSAITAMVIKAVLEHLRHRMELRMHANDYRAPRPVRRDAW